MKTPAYVDLDYRHRLRQPLPRNPAAEIALHRLLRCSRNTSSLLSSSLEECFFTDTGMPSITSPTNMAAEGRMQSRTHDVYSVSNLRGMDKMFSQHACICSQLSYNITRCDGNMSGYSFVISSGSDLQWTFAFFHNSRKHVWSRLGSSLAPPSLQSYKYTSLWSHKSVPQLQVAFLSHQAYCPTSMCNLRKSMLLKS